MAEGGAAAWFGEDAGGGGGAGDAGGCVEVDDAEVNGVGAGIANCGGLLSEIC